jgi:hypothetical protein
MANTHSLDLERDSSQYAAITDASQTGLNFTTGTYNLSGWFKFESLPNGGGFTNNRMFLTKDEYGTGGSANRSYTWYLNNDRKLYLEWQDSSSNITSISTTNVPFLQTDTGIWYHLAVVFNIGSKTGTHYINGSSVATTIVAANANSIRDGNAPVAIGCQFSNATPTPVQCYDGLVDDVRVYSADMSASLSTIMTTEAVGNEANLVAYWKLNNDYLDMTANNNDLTAVGSPVFSTDVPFVGGAGRTYVNSRNYTSTRNYVTSRNYVSSRNYLS